MQMVAVQVDMADCDNAYRHGRRWQCRWAGQIVIEQIAPVQMDWQIGRWCIADTGMADGDSAVGGMGDGQNRW